MLAKLTEISRPDTKDFKQMSQPHKLLILLEKSNQLALRLDIDLFPINRPVRPSTFLDTHAFCSSSGLILSDLAWGTLRHYLGKTFTLD